MGLGHWAADAGAGYTYLNEQIGFEWSAVAGLTYNFINPYTQYQSGIDAHLDWAISPYLSDKFHLGAVGYVYNQLMAGGETRACLEPKSVFSFQSRTAKVTSISEAITSSTPATGCKDGRGTSRSRLRHRNRSRGNGRFQGSPRSHADRDRVIEDSRLDA